MNTFKLPIALTMGEPSGISAEITLKAWQTDRDKLPPFFIIDDPNRLDNISTTLGWNVGIHIIQDPIEAIDVFKDNLPVLPLNEKVVANLSVPSMANSKPVLNSICTAVNLALQGQARAIVTNPIHKSTLYDAGFKYSGHTEYLADLVALKTEPGMLFVSKHLKIVTVTRHVSLLEALQRLSTQLIVETSKLTIEALKKDFGIAQPRIAISALNPHSGEDGFMGKEEIEIIKPAIEKLKSFNFMVSGPHPADTLFHENARKKYDGFVCMHHDQALIPIKTLDFNSAANVTLGLPFIRTSPDHGTALDIAGSGIADPSGLIAAIITADEIADKRARLASKD
ncbi:MAG: 4-hydroxythreonine-4-phosphate dehydrogenase PdxA [Pseudomonadota bacterium]|nr:4-hydroxythreonine-4-phosphate dehydrogenase PdxA [Pseudomonadota bacterium]